MDLSSLKFDRCGLEGSESSLFWDTLGFFEKVQTVFGELLWSHLYENVASMDKKEEDQISAALGLTPTYLCGSQISHARRPRLFWHTWELVEEWKDKSSTVDGRVHVPLVADPLA